MQSRVPTIGRCPLTPSVAAERRHHREPGLVLAQQDELARLRLFFKPGQVLPGLGLLVRVAPQEAVGRPVRAGCRCLRQNRCMAERLVRMPWVL